MSGIQTSNITTATDENLELDPAGSGKVKINALDGTGDSQVAVNSTGEVKKLVAADLPRIEQPVSGDLLVIHAGSTRVGDSVTQGSIYAVDADELAGTRGIDPSPADVTAVPPFVSGTGTQADPYVCTPAVVSESGGNASSEQRITVVGTELGLVSFVDISEGAAAGRFQQPAGQITNGTYDFNLRYEDTPSTPVGDGQVYDGRVKLGNTTVWFKWEVSQVSNSSVFAPASAPTASPSTVNFALDGKYGTVTAPWSDGTRVLEVSEELIFGINEGSLTSSSKNVQTGDIVKVAFNPTVVAAVTEGSLIQGELRSQDGVYFNTMSFIKDTTPGVFSLPTFTEQPTSAVVTTSPTTLQGFNSPTTITTATAGANPLTSVEVSVAGAAFTSSYPVTYNPGDSLQVRGTTGAAADTTYSVAITIGGVQATFSATTGASAAAIATPQIFNPGNFDGVEQSEDVGITASQFSLVDGTTAGHVSSDWEAYTALPSAAPATLESDVISSVNQGTYVAVNGMRYAGGWANAFNGTLDGSGVAPNGGPTDDMSTTAYFNPPLGVGATIVAYWGANRFGGGKLLVNGVNIINDYVNGVDGGSGERDITGLFPAGISSITCFNTGDDNPTPFRGLRINGTLHVLPAAYFYEKELQLTSGDNLGRFQLGNDVQQSGSYAPVSGLIQNVASSPKWEAQNFSENARKSTGTNSVIGDPAAIFDGSTTTSCTIFSNNSPTDASIYIPFPEPVYGSVVSFWASRNYRTPSPRPTIYFADGGSQSVPATVFNGITSTPTAYDVAVSGGPRLISAINLYIEEGASVDDFYFYWNAIAIDGQLLINGVAGPDGGPNKQLTLVDNTDLAYMQEGDIVQSSTPYVGDWVSQTYPSGQEQPTINIWDGDANTYGDIAKLSNAGGSGKIQFDGSGILLAAGDEVKVKYILTGGSSVSANISIYTNNGQIFTDSTQRTNTFTYTATGGEYFTKIEGSGQGSDTGQSAFVGVYEITINGFPLVQTGRETTTEIYKVDVANRKLTVTGGAWSATDGTGTGWDQSTVWSTGWQNSSTGWINGYFGVGSLQNGEQAFNGTTGPGGTRAYAEGGTGITWNAPIAVSGSTVTIELYADKGVDPNAYYAYQINGIQYTTNEAPGAAGNYIWQVSHPLTGGVLNSIAFTNGRPGSTTSGGSGFGMTAVYVDGKRLVDLGIGGGVAAVNKVTVESPLKLGTGSLSSIDFSGNKMRVDNVRQTIWVSTANGGSGTGTPSEFKVQDPSIAGSPVAPSTEPPDTSKYLLHEQDLASSELTFWQPTTPFATGSTIFTRVRYNTAGDSSAYSDWTGFNVQSVPEAGQAFAGGYFVGQINSGGTIYNLIVAPKTSSGLQGETLDNVQYRTNTGNDGRNTEIAERQDYGGPMTNQQPNVETEYPLFYWCKGNPDGPNAGAFNLSTGGVDTGTGIGGYNDWYIPAKNELEMCYRNLKPTLDNNNTSSGSNPDSVPPQANYTSSNPARTPITVFQTGGSEAFDSQRSYWSSSQYPQNWSNAFGQAFGGGGQTNEGKTSTSGFKGRAVRRQAA